jgi:hypothetical protein
MRPVCLGQMRSKVNLTRLMQYSAKLCETIGAEVDQDVGWRNVGSLRLGQQRCALGGIEARRDGGEELRLRSRIGRAERGQEPLSAGRSSRMCAARPGSRRTAMSIPIR